MTKRHLSPKAWAHESGRVAPGTKGKTYKNLREFNATCTKRGSRGGICTITNFRCTKDGGGLATVHEEKALRGGRDRVWRLHFASCTVMRQHLDGRVDDPASFISRGKR